MLSPRVQAGAIGWVVKDSFRQASASRIAWVLLALSGLAIVLCLGSRVEVEPGAGARDAVGILETEAPSLPGAGARATSLVLAFGAIRVEGFRDGATAIDFLGKLLARRAAGGVGVLLLLLATAGLIPEMLRPDVAPFLLTRPTPRASLIVGRVLGAFAFAFTMTGTFFLGTWLALAWRTGDLQPAYLLAWPLLLVQFGAVYAASVLIGVVTRNTLAAALAGAAFWGLGLTANTAYQASVTSGLESSIGPLMRGAGSIAYWLLPKPADAMLVLDHVLRYHDHFPLRPEAEAMLRVGAFSPWASVASSLAIALALIALAAHEARSIEY